MKQRIVLILLASLLSHSRLSTTRAFLPAALPRSHRLLRPSLSHSYTSFRLYQSTSSSSPSPEDPSNNHKKKSQQDNDTGTSSSSNEDSTSPASSLSTSSSTDTTTVPSYQSIIIFVSTTILIWLSEPLLSLVDTTLVGRQACAKAALTQLAALGPATMLIDSLVYLTYFLSIATTCKMAKSYARHQYTEMQSTSSQILGVAGVLGLLMTFIIYTFGKPLLYWCAGDAASASLVSAALHYCQIRTCVAVLSIMAMVAQSICLAVQDTTTPAIAVLVASITNVVGDLVLIPKFGLEGAAIATATASVASAYVLLQSIRNKTRQWKKRASENTKSAVNVNGSAVTKINGSGVNGGNATMTAQQPVSSVVVDGMPVLNTNATRVIPTNATISSSNLERLGMLFTKPRATRVVPTNATTSSNLERLGIFTKPRATLNKRNKEDDIPFISLPNGRSTLELMQLAGPIFFVIIGKVICYASLTLKATNFGVLQVATHNIMMRIFFFHATFGDSLTQAAQTYLPSTLLQKSNSQIKVLLKKLTILGTGIGIFNYISTKCVLQMGHLFTSNTRIIASMAQHTTSISWATLLHGYIMIFEGVLIATGDLKYLVATYAMTMGVLFAQLKYATPHFGGVWIALLLFQVLRLAQFKSRVVHKVLLRGISGGREEFVETQAVEQ